jgi:hypothetical protein
MAEETVLENRTTHNTTRETLDECRTLLVELFGMLDTTSRTTAATLAAHAVVRTVLGMIDDDLEDTARQTQAV